MGQDEVSAPPASNAALGDVAQEAEEEGEVAWAFSASLYTYFVPDDADYVQPTFTADHGWLHLEARYAYEAPETGSAWLGYNLAGGGKVTWELTPMLGGVFGETMGIAPGLRGSVTWWKLELSAEVEYVMDVGESSDSFFYAWSELTLAPVDWFRFGLVAQRTRAYDADRDIQRGVLAGFSWKYLDLATYVFNVDDSDPTVVVAVSASF